MKIQLEEIDLLEPWPDLPLRDGYRTMSVLVRLGRIAIGEVMLRPARTAALTHRRLRRVIARKLAFQLVSNVVREGFSVGPEMLQSIPPATFPPGRLMMLMPWRKSLEWVEENLVLPEGLPAPLADWVRAAQDKRRFDCPAVTIAICTRDRASMLEGCLRTLKTLEYPGEFEILVVDNSSDAGTPATRDIARRLGASYVRAPIAGLSRARNVALAAARYPWVAFTDDDCRPEPHWLLELVRPVQADNCRAVCGIVLPAQLENSAEITFELYGGLARGFMPKVYDLGFLRNSRLQAPQTWRIGAGANMLLHRKTVLALGGFDEDMGPGGVGGCGEDTLVFYQLLRSRHTVHYTPRAIVHHYHRSSPAALRKQIHSYAVGHAAYLWRVLFQYFDYRSLLRLAGHLPWWFVQNVRAGLDARTKYPLPLVLLEMKGTLMGPIAYTGAKVKRLTRWLFGRSRAAGAPAPHSPTVVPPVTPPNAPDRKYYDALAGKKSHRAA